MSSRNDIRLLTRLDEKDVSHFRLREFENRDGLAMVHPATLLALEQVRRDLNAIIGEDVWLIVTDAVRTQSDLERLARRYGWADEGGKVSRNSKHLAKYGGIAVDVIGIVASSRARVPQAKVGATCRKYFDWVKDDYRDGHVHADMRGVIEN